MLAAALVALWPTFLLHTLQFLKDPLFIAGALAVVALVLTGRLPQALFTAAALFPLITRFMGVWNRWRAANGPAEGQTSEIETDWLRMRLDHDTGTMSGTVKRGRFAGQRLDELILADLVELLRECRVEDDSSAKLLETYLDRCFPGWRDGGRSGEERQERSSGGTGGRSRSSAAMTKEEAYEVLGLQPGASEEEIRAAHKRLMMKLHPDQGGTTWLAARINLAKDTLLKA
jgi:hypothetical protein